MTEHAAKMTFGRKHVIASVALLAAVGGLILLLSKGLTFDQKKIPSELIGKPGKDFTVSWIQGQEFLRAAPNDSFSLRHFRGHNVILNFWASWCMSCQEEAHELDAFWRAHASSGTYVVGIAIQDTKEAALQFAKTYGKSYILGLDTDGHAAIDYGVTGVPETFIIDRDGKIVDKEVGPVTVPMLEQYLAKLK